MSAGEGGAQPQVLRRLYAQYEVVSILAEAEDFAAAAPRVLEAISTSLEWKVGTAWLREERDEALYCEAIWQDPAIPGRVFGETSQDLRLRLGVGLPGRVAERREPIWIEDVRKFPGFVRVQAAEDLGLRAAFAFPIQWHDEVLGAIDFFAQEVRQPDPELLKATESVGTQLGHFIARKRAEQSLRYSEAVKRAIVDASLDCVVTMDMDGRIVDFNPAAEQTFGYSRDAVVGRDMAEVIIPPGLRDAHRAALERRNDGGAPRILGQRLELQGMRAGGAEFPVELTVTQLADSDPPLFAGFIRDITDRVQAKEDRERVLALETEAREQSERLVIEALEAEERERERISQRLHDDVLQSLAAAKVLLAPLAEAKSAPAEASRRALQDAMDLTRDTIAELHPAIVHEGGIEHALRGIVKTAERRGGFRCSLHVDPSAVGFHDGFVANATRELLANVGKHASAREAEVSLARRGNFVELVVRDDGCGIPAGRSIAALRQGHIGLASLKVRAEGLGGTITTSHRASGGTAVGLLLPTDLC